MDLWKTKQKHKIGKRKETHMVKICIPTAGMDHILRGFDILRNHHNVPDSAYIRLVIGFGNVWVQANWTKDI